MCYHLTYMDTQWSKGRPLGLCPQGKLLPFIPGTFRFRANGPHTAVAADVAPLRSATRLNLAVNESSYN